MDISVNTRVVINSLSVNKNNEGEFDFQKYNIEVSIDEIENTESHNKLKFGITLLTEPKNVRLSIDGVVEISGNESERAKILEKDENNIPRVLHIIYQELFPVFFMTTKTIGAPCPAYSLSQISPPTEIEEPQIEESQRIGFGSKSEKPIEKDEETTEQPDVEKTIPEPIVLEQSKGDSQVITDILPPEQTAAQAATEQLAAQAATEQPAAQAAPEQPAAQQPTAQPNVVKTSAEKSPEEMTLEELNQLYAKLGSDYQTNPSTELGTKINEISNLMQKRQQEQMVNT